MAPFCIESVVYLELETANDLILRIPSSQIRTYDLQHIPSYIH